MKFLEKDLEEILVETPNEKLQERGLNITGKRFSQLRIGNYGRADLVTFSKPDYFVKDENRGIHYDACLITVYELKKDKISISAFLQAVRYAKGIKSYIDKRKPSMHVEIKIVLIGKELPLNSDLMYLNQLYDDFDMYSYNYSVDGLFFKECGSYSLTKEGFNV